MEEKLEDKIAQCFILEKTMKQSFPKWTMKTQQGLILMMKGGM